MKGTLLILVLFASALAIHSCDGISKDASSRTYEDSYASTGGETMMDPNADSVNGYASTSYSTESSIEQNPYYNNSLSTGDEPYPTNGLYGSDSQITIRTSANSSCDVVAIVKRYGEICADAYIAAGDSYTFNLPNGQYQVFFYGGKGWNPNKQMVGGRQGGFVANESYSKDSPVNLDDQGLEYSLIPQPNGNFTTEQSNPNEIF